MKKLAIWLCILIVAGAGVASWMRGRSKQDANPGNLQTVRVERGTVELTVSADGTLKPLTTVVVKSYAGGRVDVLAVDVGDRVQAGDLIAKIDPTDSLTTYEQARADLAASQAKLRQARDQAGAQPGLTRSAIAQAEAAYNSALKDLQHLQRATQPQTKAQARAALDKAMANLDIAEPELARTPGLKAQ